MCVELQSGHGPLRGIYGRKVRASPTLANTRLSVRGERHLVSRGATAKRCENCLHQMIALAKSAGSVPGGRS